MNIYEAIHERRSTRAFTAEPVEQHLIVRLIEAAAQAPSAMNLQPWVFTVVRDQALLEQGYRPMRKRTWQSTVAISCLNLCKRC
ncbi:nitroreductase family protein [Pseudomonas sp. L7]|uniref:nitroreductase family protein n=1 Tax=unclassified Pseudomonas TaxID=196821 RepID=UPI003208DE62